MRVHALPGQIPNLPIQRNTERLAYAANFFPSFQPLICHDRGPCEIITPHSNPLDKVLPSREKDFLPFFFFPFLLFSFDFFPHRMQAYLSTIHNPGIHYWRDESTVKLPSYFEGEAERFTHTSLQGALPSTNQSCINSKKQHEIAYSLRGGRKRRGHLTNLNCRLCFHCAGNC